MEASLEAVWGLLLLIDIAAVKYLYDGTAIYKQLYTITVAHF